MEDTEWKLRCDLAACHHLFHHFGWTDVIFTHLSVRLPQNKNHYLTTPYGLMFDEVTASNLVKVDFEGNILAGESYMNAGHAIHTAIMKTRQNVNCIFHSHTPCGNCSVMYARRTTELVTTIRRNTRQNKLLRLPFTRGSEYSGMRQIRKRYWQ